MCSATCFGAAHASSFMSTYPLGTHVVTGGCALPAVNLHCVTLVAAGLRVTSVATSGTCIWTGTEDGQLLLVHLPT